MRADPVSKMERFGFVKRPFVALYSWLRKNLPTLLLLNAASEIAYAIVCVILALVTFGKKMSILQTISMVHILKLRYHSVRDGGASRHAQVWNAIAFRTNPLLNSLPILQRPVSFIKRWFTSSSI